MYNIGTSTSALGTEHQLEALNWWWKALQARPTYWDAIVSMVPIYVIVQMLSDANVHEPHPSKDNILGCLISPSQSHVQQAAAVSRALDVCDHVQQHIFDAAGRLIRSISPADLHRLQKVLYTAGSIKETATESRNSATPETLRAIELAFRPSLSQVESEPISLGDIILSTYIACYIVYSESGGLVPPCVSGLFTPGSPLFTPPIDIWKLVRQSADTLLLSLIQEGGGSLPFLLLLPHQVTRVLTVLFPSSSGILPAICTRAPDRIALQTPPEALRQQTNFTTSTALLTLAKHYQEAAQSAIPIPGLENISNTGQPLALLLYYLALGLSPSPSTYNNMGIILSGTTSTRDYFDTVTGPCSLTGLTLAKVYYEAGLQMDPEHPHLLTNLGSLIKDQGRIAVSIE